MIHTIRAFYPQEFDQRVNDFEKAHTSPAGISSVFATQTHIIPPMAEGDTTTYIAVIFYREARP